MNPKLFHPGVICGVAYLLASPFCIYSFREPPALTITYSSAGKKGDEGRFEVKGLSPPQIKVLVDENKLNQCLKITTQGNQALLGKTGISNGVLWFQPRFPLSTDLEHKVTFLPPSGARTISIIFQLPTPNTASPRITAIYPTTDQIPENLLKFYVHFSNPMRHGEIYSRVRILNEAGKPVGLPFLELDEELWDATMTRVTLLIDPGRIKRGVQGRIDEGPVFEAGKSFVLEIDGELLDAAGKPLGKSMKKNLKVTAPVHLRVDPTDWNLIVPRKSGDPLEVRFPRSLDQALLMREINIFNEKGEQLKGKMATLEKETIWRFHPDTPWVPANYQLRVGLTLEDLAGNRPDRVFDAPPKDSKDNAEPILKLDFRVN